MMDSRFGRRFIRDSELKIITGANRLGSGEPFCLIGRVE